MRMKLKTIFFSCLFSFSQLLALEYQRPDKNISDLVEAGEAPGLVVNRSRTFALELHYTSMPSIHYHSRPIEKLAGLEFFTQNLSPVTTQILERFYLIPLRHPKKRIELKNSHSSTVRSPKFNASGDHVAYEVLTPDCVELWIAATATGVNRRVPNVCLNGVLGDAFSWVGDHRVLFKSRIGNDFRRPSVVPTGPMVLESDDREAKNRTYQNLLKSREDQQYFASVTQSQLMIVNIKQLKPKLLLKPAIYSSLSISPDQHYLLVTKITAPFSFQVPVGRFAREVSVHKIGGGFHQVISRLPVQEHLPIGGVAEGIRVVEWITALPSSLMTVEALDKGDWKNKVAHRDLIKFIEIRDQRAFNIQTQFKTIHRFSDMVWFEDGKRAILWDFERDQKRASAELIDFFSGKSIRRLWEFGVNDVYNLPGELVLMPNSFNRMTIRPLLQDQQEWLFLEGEGATPEGDRPFLKRFSLSTSEVKTVMLSRKDHYDNFVLFLDQDFQRYLLREQSPKLPPRLVEKKIDDPTFSNVLWSRQGPTDIFSSIKSQLLTYKRKDGVELSGVLYYPYDYQPGKRYPLIIHAYPKQYSSEEEAGQVRVAMTKYLSPYRADIKYFLLKGYVLLDRAQMPIIGNPQTMNDSFLEQITMNASAAIKAVDELNIIDRQRVGIIGHSYGAFMVANLLTHTDLFKAGIARSGAYNRSLTPNGFQNERRTFWEAPEVYMKLSPFASANRIERPILLIHGEEDANPGTFPMQTERYFQALQSNGKTARMVILPKEGHHYAAKESVLHILWEQHRFFDQYLQ